MGNRGVVEVAGIDRKGLAGRHRDLAERIRPIRLGCPRGRALEDYRMPGGKAIHGECDSIEDDRIVGRGPCPGIGKAHLPLACESDL